jgi:hypothetical protein
MRPLKFILIALLASATFYASAQEPGPCCRPRSTQDFTTTQFLSGTPKLDPPTTGSIGAGATTLPGNLPFGTYTNSAPYALQVSMVRRIRSDFGADILMGYVNGTLVASETADVDGRHQSINFVVPPGATFKAIARHSYSSPFDDLPVLDIGVHEQQVTVVALADNASWAQTGISFHSIVQVISNTTTCAQLKSPPNEEGIVHIIGYSLAMRVQYIGRNNINGNLSTVTWSPQPLISTTGFAACATGDIAG